MIDIFGRELPTEVAASVMYLSSMGHDEAAIELRDGWFDQPVEESHDSQSGATS